MTPVERLDRFVVPAFREYLEAEDTLTQAVISKADTSPAGDLAMRRVSSMASDAWHLADWVWEQRGTLGADAVFQCTSLGTFRAEVERRHCRMGRDGAPIRDFNLIGSIADAFKHYRVGNPAREVATADMVIVVAAGFGTMTYGEGKYGSPLQVVVDLRSGKRRAFSSIAQNVMDMWRLAFGAPLPPMGR